MNADILGGGFTDTSRDAAIAFRATLDALSRPGTIVTVAGAIPPAPLSIAAGVVILTLIDGTTPLHLAGGYDTKPVRDWITFHTGAPLVAAQNAAFALGDWAALQPLGRFAIGSPEYPDRSATLIVECANLAASGTTLTGPGINGSARLSLPDPAAFAANARLYPLGLDFFLTCGTQLAGLPRSARIEMC